MRINGSSFDPLRPDRVNPGGQHAEPRPGDPGARPSAPPRDKADTVNISQAGRSLAKRLEAQQPDSLAPERVDALRTKVLSGAYNSLEVVDTVARRILSRGEL